MPFHAENLVFDGEDAELVCVVADVAMAMGDEMVWSDGFHAKLSSGPGGEGSCGQ